LENRDELGALISLDKDLTILDRSTDTATLAKSPPQYLEIFTRANKARDESHLLPSPLFTRQGEAKALLYWRQCCLLGSILLCSVAIVWIGAVEYA
jgi:hypothetical protein